MSNDQYVTLNEDLDAFTITTEESSISNEEENLLI